MGLSTITCLVTMKTRALTNQQKIENQQPIELTYNTSQVFQSYRCRSIKKHQLQMDVQKLERFMCVV